MKKGLALSMVILFLASTLLSASACKESAPPSYWQPLLEDKEWVQDLNQWLSLSYVEEKDRAAFTGWLVLNGLSPSLYSTYAGIKILKAIGKTIENPGQIADWIDSLRNEQGLYSDPTSNIPFPAMTTNRAITVLTELDIQPRDVDATVSYLLSLQNDDGTFLMGFEKDERTSMKDTSLKRLGRGTYDVVGSLLKLGLGDKIPQKTKDAILAEVVSVLGEEGPFPSMLEQDSPTIVAAIELLARIDPSMVPERARAFVGHALKEAPDMPAHTVVVPSAMTRLLDIAELLGLPEAKQESILEGLRGYLKEKIFPLQNLSGGFGPSETVEPLTTGVIVILANRLGVTYPNLPRLLTELNEHRVSNGWVLFLVPSIDNALYQWTYYALEIAKFSGYTGYNKDKVAKYLAGCFSNNTAMLRDIYFAVMGLKSLNNELSKEERQEAEEASLRLARRLTILNTHTSTDFAYASLISSEVGFELPEEVKTVITGLARQMKSDMFSGETTLIAERLQLLWESLDKENTVLSKDEAMEYLDSLYADYGGYTVPMTVVVTTTPEVTFTKTRRPDVYQTYSALKLLSDMGASLPDKDKTLSFIMSSKHKYGFDYAPMEFMGDRSIPTFMSTYAALMILKQISS